MNPFSALFLTGSMSKCRLKEKNRSCRVKETNLFFKQRMTHPPTHSNSTNLPTNLPSSSLLGLEIVHIDGRHRPANKFHGSQSRDITSGIVFNKESNVAHSLKLDIFQGRRIGRFLQIFGGQMQGLRRIDVFPIFESNFPIQENMNFGRIQFRIGAIVEFRKFDRVELFDNE